MCIYDKKSHTRARGTQGLRAFFLNNKFSELCVAWERRKTNLSQSFRTRKKKKVDIQLIFFIIWYYYFLLDDFFFPPRFSLAIFEIEFEKFVIYFDSWKKNENITRFLIFVLSFFSGSNKVRVKVAIKLGLKESDQFNQHFSWLFHEVDWLQWNCL